MVISWLIWTGLAIAGMPAMSSDGTVRTVKMENPDSFMAPPVIRLGTSDRLRLNFDIIGEDREYLRYRLIHCNSDWTPSRLLEQEYLSGFNEGEVADIAFSSNTFTHYVNYNIELPSEEIAPVVSGNYLLQVFREDSPEDVLFQTGFYVSENIVGIQGEATSRTDRGFNTEYQQIEFTADLGSAGNLNPWQDIRVCVVKNNAPGSTVMTGHPLRVENGIATFSHDPNLIFEAGNEYRRFETVRSDYPGMGVDSIGFYGERRRAYLTPDHPQKGRSYEYDRTQHGRFKIDEYNSTDPDLGADYIVTKFSLEMPEQPGKEITVEGELTRHLPEGMAKMSYNAERGAYELELPLKQGSYNYRYVMGDDSGRIYDSALEGNHYETSNEYLVLIYLRLPATRGERLLGATVIY
ncbi:MAG: DUF5103 domain-containing protein [Bacteroides sp.]|nr:DUF5103 domain-containing protein [Bacteroides sp.]